MEEECPDAAETLTLGSPSLANSKQTNNNNNIESHTTACSSLNTISKIEQLDNFKQKQQSFDQDQIEKPTTSRTSMSVLQEADFAKSKHDNFPEVVLDDETTTSGVLETFEISSSNSLSTSTSSSSSNSSNDGGNATVTVEDNSSTDTIKLVEVSASARARQHAYFNRTEVYVINDEDSSDDEDVETGDESVHDPNSSDDTDDDTPMPEGGIRGSGDEEEDEELEVTSQVKNSTQSTQSEQQQQQQMNSVIVTKSGAAIYLETPMIEDQHHSQMLNTDSGGGGGRSEMTGKPKCLNDKFLLAEQEEDENVNDDTPNASSSVSYKIVQAKHNNNNNNNKNVDMDESIRGLKIKSENRKNKEAAVNDEKVARRYKFRTVSNTRNEDIDPALLVPPPYLRDTQCMDLIERRDFEVEHQLTGGIILKASVLAGREKLNVNYVKSHKQQHQHKKQEQTNGEGAKDCPCSSSSINAGREVSSDSKYTYKDPQTTPTSSRIYNSRLTKSTAKLNLSSTLNQSQPQSEQSNVCTYKIVRKAQLPASSTATGAASVIKVAPSTTTAASTEASASTSQSKLATSSSSSSSSLSSSVINNNSSGSSTTRTAAGTQTKLSVFKPTTSSSTSTNDCQQPNESKRGLARESGCSRTRWPNSMLNPMPLPSESDLALHSLFDENQPSTSSARCHYAGTSKGARQMQNASAQTNERYHTDSRDVIIRPASLNRASESSTSNSNSTSTSNNVLNTSRASRQASRQAEFFEAVSAFKAALAEVAEVTGTNRADRSDFNEDDSWADCEENNSDMEEICTCERSCSSSHNGSVISLNDADDGDIESGCNRESELSNFIQMVSISEEPNNGGGSVPSNSTECNLNVSLPANSQQRKRKYNDSRSIEIEYNLSTATLAEPNLSRKRIAYDFAATPTSAPQSTALVATTPTSTISSTYGRRTPRTLIPTRDNPPPEMPNWLEQFRSWTHAERLLAIDNLIDHCEPTQVRHMMKVIEPQFQRDFISLLPRELALQVLSYLDPKDLLRAAQTCRSWRYLCDDNLLWKEKCRKAQILTEPCSDKPKRGRAGKMPPIASPWKAAYMRQHIIEMNWRSRPIREPKVLKGHDDHVITCLQFSGNRIVSGSDDNTLKVWSAVTGRCLRTLVGHTGGVWSSQMSGNVIISGSTDRTLKVWDMETGHCVHTLLGHTSTVRCMHLHGNKVVSGSRDATLRVWDISEGSCLHVLTGHLAAVRCVQYDGKLIVSGAYDYMVKIWHPERQECLHTLQGHTNRVYSLQFDGVHVVSGSLDTSIRVWDVETGNCKHTLMGHQSLTSGMELRQNILVSGNADSTVKVWDITTGQCLQTLSGSNKHQSAVTCLQFNSRFVITSSDDGTVKLWDVKTGEFIRNLVALDSGGSGGVVWRIRANDTKLICAVGSRNGTEETKLMVLDFDVEGACVKCS